MECTQVSSWALSVSSSQGLTSKRMEDLATGVGFLALFSVYWLSLSYRIRATSFSSSSSLPNSITKGSSSVGSSTPQAADQVATEIFSSVSLYQCSPLYSAIFFFFFFFFLI
uniref:Uncharacterized protein n=1 Tax=Mus spicilegus TaxID=10103 RepID=A0A8C6GK85_MUSSI